MGFFSWVFLFVLFCLVVGFFGFFGGVGFLCFENSNIPQMSDDFELCKVVVVSVT